MPHDIVVATSELCMEENMSAMQEVCAKLFVATDDEDEALTMAVVKRKLLSHPAVTVLLKNRAQLSACADGLLKS